MGRSGEKWGGGRRGEEWGGVGKREGRGGVLTLTHPLHGQQCRSKCTKNSMEVMLRATYACSPMNKLNTILHCEHSQPHGFTAQNIHAQHKSHISGHTFLYGPLGQKPRPQHNGGVARIGAAGDG